MKYILSIIIAVVACTSLFAQENVILQNDTLKPRKAVLPREFKQEIRIGGGWYSYPYVREISFANKQKGDLKTVSKPKTIGVYSLSFAGFVNEEWSVGVYLSLENITGRIEKQVYDSTLQQNVQAYSDYKAKVISIFPYGIKYWKQSRVMNLYSGIGLGFSLKSYNIAGTLAIDKTEDTQIGVSFQATPIGIRYGNKYAGFAELGFGTLGLLRIGFSAGF